MLHLPVGSLSVIRAHLFKSRRHFPSLRKEIHARNITMTNDYNVGKNLWPEV